MPNDNNKISRSSLSISTGVLNPNSNPHLHPKNCNNKSLLCSTSSRFYSQKKRNVSGVAAAEEQHKYLISIPSCPPRQTQKQEHPQPHKESIVQFSPKINILLQNLNKNSPNPKKSSVIAKVSGLLSGSGGLTNSSHQRLYKLRNLKTQQQQQSVGGSSYNPRNRNSYQQPQFRAASSNFDQPKNRYTTAIQPKYQEFDQIEFIKKELKTKISSLVNRSNKSLNYSSLKFLMKDCVQSYQNLKGCSNSESALRQENIFYQNLLKLFQQQSSFKSECKGCAARKNNDQKSISNPKISFQSKQSRKQQHNHTSNTTGLPLQPSSHSSHSQFAKPKRQKFKKDAGFSKYKNQNQNQYRQRVSLTELQNVKLQKQNAMLKEKLMSVMLTKVQEQLPQLTQQMLAIAEQNGSNLLAGMTCQERNNQNNQQDGATTSIQNIDSKIPNLSNIQDKSIPNFSQSLGRLATLTKHLSQQLQKQKQSNSSLKHQLALVQDAYDTAKQDWCGIIKKNEQLMASNQQLCAKLTEFHLKNQRIQERLSRFKSTLGFQHEEVLSCRAELTTIRLEYKELARKYKLLLLRKESGGNGTVKGNGKKNKQRQTDPYQKQSRRPELNNSNNVKCSDRFNEQFDTFMKVRPMFLQKDSINTLDVGIGSGISGTMKNLALSPNKKLNSSNEPQAQQRKRQEGQSSYKYKQYLTSKQTLNNSSGIRKASDDRQNHDQNDFQHRVTPNSHPYIVPSYHHYYKPSFYCLVQEYMNAHGIDQKNFQQLKIQTHQLILTLRAILDAKFNEFILSTHNSSHCNAYSSSLVSGFASSTYSWLCQFRIHARKKQPIQSSKYHEHDQSHKQTVATFYLNLMSERYNHSWEVITFRELLMDTLSKDQLYFYLLTRNYLFHGDVMTVGGIGSFSGALSAQQDEPALAINVADALILLQRFVPDLGYRRKMEEFIKKSIVHVRSKVAVVDAHFILRILLEYYQAKKVKDIKQFYSLAEVMLSKKKRSKGISTTGMLQEDNEEEEERENGNRGANSSLSYEEIIRNQNSSNNIQGNLTSKQLPGHNPSLSSHTITFDTFLRIFEFSFCYLSITEKLQIFKKVYSSTKGNVTLPAILTVIIEEGYYCYEVKQIFRNEQIKIVDKNEKNNFNEKGLFSSSAEDSDDNEEGNAPPITIEPGFEGFYKFEEFFRRFCNSHLEIEIPLIGLQSLRAHFDQIAKKQVNPQNMLTKVSLVLKLCMLSVQKLVCNKQINLEAFSFVLSDLSVICSKFLKMSCEKRQIMQIMVQFKRQSAARRILRFYSKKKAQIQRNFIFNSRQDLKQSDEKIDNIRNQFNNLIENMRESKENKFQDAVQQN